MSSRNGERGSIQIVTPVASPYGGQLGVRFLWQGDRYRHCVQWKPDGENADNQNRQAVRIASSQEGDGQTSWPTSPPMQQLETCELAGARRAILGVGMAGTSHWSVAVEAGNESVYFDFACRVRTPPQAIGSMYVVPEDDWRFADPASLSSAAPPESGVTQPSARQAICQAMAECATTQNGVPAWHLILVEGYVKRNNSQLIIAPHFNADLSFPTTLRWRYQFQLSKCRDQPLPA